MYIDSHVDISINNSKYEEIINAIKYKAPVEIGVEVAVYMLLFGLLENTNLVIVDVNSMWKSKAAVYSNANEQSKLGAVPDLVIVNKDFEYRKKDRANTAYGFIEVKSLQKKYSDQTKEMKSHLNNTNHLIWTNGIEWRYINQKRPQENWEVHLESDTIGEKACIDELKFSELLYRLKKIEWDKI